MAFLFKVQIKGVTKPPVWRRLLIPEHYNFHQFHEVIQAAFEWWDCHLYQFSPTAFGSYPQIGVPDPDFDNDMIDSSKIPLKAIFTVPGKKFTYVYDFGDNWEHQLTLEAITDAKLLRPDCVEGKGRRPPEDCGGVGGYSYLREVLKDRSHPEYEDMRQWLGLEGDETWNPNAFNLEECREAVREC